MAPRSTLKLTKRLIDGLELPSESERSRILWDSGVRGFGVRVFAWGTRVFVFQYRHEGRTKRLRLGVYPSITVEEARALAKQAAGKVARGEIPQFRATPNEAETIGALFSAFLDERRGKIKPRTQAEYQRLWDKVLSPVFARKEVARVDESTVARWHSELRPTPMLANRAVDLLSGFFAWAERRGYRPKLSNPCPGVERYEEQPRSRSLTREEYRALGRALDRALTEGLRPAPKQQKHTKNEAKRKHRPRKADTPRKANPTIIAALRFLALSGWREQEALTLRWDALDFARGTATLQDTKSDRSVRPLGKPAIDLLRTQSRIPGNPYVFPGAKPGTHLQEPKFTWTSIRYAAGLQLRLHDLRHSFTTVASDDLGIHDRFIAGLIGHKLRGTTARYGEIRESTLQHKADEIASVIDSYMRTDDDAKVLPFPAPSAR